MRRRSPSWASCGPVCCGIAGSAVVSARRDPSEWRQRRPGAVLVFNSGGRYQRFEDHQFATGGESVVVNAVTVSLVDERPRMVPALITVPSSSPAFDFVINAGFR